MPVHITISGLRELEAKCDRATVDRAQDTIIKKGVIYGSNKAKERAPVDTGRLRGAQGWELGAGSPAPWGKYGTLGASEGAVMVYGRKLDESKEREYRYRRGPRQGDPTKGWFSDTEQDTQQYVDGLIADEAKRIERDWSR